MRISSALWNLASILLEAAHVDIASGPGVSVDRADRAPDTDALQQFWMAESPGNGNAPVTIS
jgi:hypothetical protein